MSFSRFAAPIFPSHSRDLFRLLEDLSTVPTAMANTQRRAFSPNFDVHETSESYVLEGELPGIEDKSKINIEFTDSQTLLIRGRVERSYTTTSDEGKERKESKKEEESKEITITGERALTKAEEGHKFWISERSVGEFQRSFSFPTSIDIDNVRASLEHGILKIVVPKKEESKGRKIEIH